MNTSEVARTAKSARGEADTVRLICRAVIRRVLEEHPDSSGYDLFLRLWAAYPFGSAEAGLQTIWNSEMMRIVGPLDDERAQLWSAPGPLIVQ